MGKNTLPISFLPAAPGSLGRPVMRNGGHATAMASVVPPLPCPTLVVKMLKPHSSRSWASSDARLLDSL